MFDSLTRPWTRRVLVTGAAGFIGSHFVHVVRDRHPDWLVVNLDLLTYAADLGNLARVLGPESGQGIKGAEVGRVPLEASDKGLAYGERLIGVDPAHVLVRGDVADGELVRGLFEEFRFDFVVHFAAESHVDRSILDAAPFIRTNVEGTRVLLDAAREAGVERFVQVSTDEVYGDREGLNAADEEAAPRPSSPYSASKAAADLLALAYHRTYGVPVVITRSCNNYGPHQFPEKLIPLMVWKAAEGQPLPVYGDGQQRREWVWVEDNAEAILRVLEGGRVGEVYNIGTGEPVPNLEVVRRICDLVAERLGRPKDAVRQLITSVQDRPGHDRLYHMVSDKVRQELGWAPRMDFEEGLARTVEWYLARLEKVRRVASGEHQRYFEAVYQRGWKPPGAAREGRGAARAREGHERGRQL